MVFVGFGILQFSCRSIRPPNLDSLNAIAFTQPKVNRTGVLTVQGVTSNDGINLLAGAGSDDDPDTDGGKVRPSLTQSNPDPVV